MRLCVSPILASKGNGLAYGAPNLFEQFSEPFAEPHIFKVASRNLAIYPGFVLGCAIVACSPPWPQGRPFHSAASQSIDDRLFQRACLSVASVESLSIPIGHPHQESGAQQGITEDSGRSRKDLERRSAFGKINFSTSNDKRLT